MHPVPGIRMFRNKRIHSLYRDPCSSSRDKMLKKMLPGTFSPELKGVSMDYGSLCPTKKILPPCLLTDKIHEQKTTLENYPMEHNCSDTVKMYQERRAQLDQEMLNTKRDEDESKQLLMKSKQLFEFSLVERRQGFMSFLGREESTLFPELDSGHMTAVEHPPKTSMLVQRPGFKPLCSFGPGRVLNHCRGRCKAQPRICRHIKNISPQYQVSCMRPPDVCEARWSSGNYSVASGFFLVPLQKDLSKDELEDTRENQLTTEEAIKSELIIPGQASFLSGNKPQLSRTILELLKDEAEEKCWIDNATVTSAREDEQMPENGEEGEEEADSQPHSIHEMIDAEEQLRSAASIDSKEIVKEVNVVQSGLEPLAKISQMKSMFDAPAISVVHSPEPAEARLPGLICPSDVSKSQKTEIKKWLQKSSFSAASKIRPFIT